MSVLFMECVEALGDGGSLVSGAEAQERINEVQVEYTFSSSGRLLAGPNGEGVRLGIDMALGVFGQDEKVFLFWDDASVPGLIVDLKSIRNCLFDVLAVGFYTYLYSKERGVLIELTGNGDALVCK
ncbi:hypothetical protein CFN79_18640 [Chromobacterium vaccinii]|uniref:CDI toxin immunity protein n=1 Tax=Chromobacterium vaccinii TaxID=1108595 RepID=UPI000CE93A2A|nr:hypothetical protein [Chromobacterium vaccinii]AVG17719.1 hypothetical protein CFN79_18640 [Chromobacterium vaccinii]